MAAARDAVMPAIFARVDKRGTPAAGVLIAGTLATLLVFANFSKSLVQLFTFAILLATAATLLPYFVSSAAWLRRGDRSGRVVAVLALLYSAYALAGIGTESLLWGIVLVAAGLVATAWSTRRAVNDAYDAVRDGHAFTVQQAVRADFADLGGPPTADQLAAILAEHKNEGLVYLAMLDGRGTVQAAAGTPVVERPGRADRTGIRIEHVGDRVRLEMRAQFRRAWGPGRGARTEVTVPRAPRGRHQAHPS